MDRSNDKDMLKRKLAIYEFGCRNNFIFNVQVIAYLLSVSEKVSRNGMYPCLLIFTYTVTISTNLPPARLIPSQITSRPG